MAIKGKKKARGSQARRRPAAMPRPAVTPRKPPWYKTTAGMTILSIGGLLLLLLIVWGVTSSRSRAQELEERQEALEEYTGAVEALGQDIAGAVSGMNAAAGADPAELGEDAAGWVQDLDEAQGAVAQLFPPEGADAANQLFTQAVLAWRSAARTFQLAGEAEGKLAGDLATQGTTQAASATTLWTTATELLDEERDAAELRSSGIDVPGGEAMTQPGGGQSIQIPSGDDGAGGAGGGNNGGADNGGGGDGNDAGGGGSDGG